MVEYLVECMKIAMYSWIGTLIWGLMATVAVATVVAVGTFISSLLGE